MKKLLLFLLCATVSFHGYSQNPDLYQTWYLVSYSNDMGETFLLADVDPFLTVDMTIDAQLLVEGQACNEYFGEFLYDSTNDRLELTFFDLCLCGTCNNPPQSHVNLENDYFEYFFGFEGSFYEYEISTDPGTGVMGLTLENIPGFVLEYQNVPVLGVSEFGVGMVVISPNPVLETLFITSKETLQSITIYNIAGQIMLSETEIQNQIDVSKLTPALYFAEFTTSEGKSIQKFIKK